MLRSLGLGRLTEPLMAAEEDGRPPRPKRLSTSSKVEQVIKAAAETADAKDVHPAVGSCLRASAPIATAVVSAAQLVAPMLAWLYTQAYLIYLAAPRK